MESLTDLRFACDVLWSKYNSQFSPEYMYNARFAMLHEYQPLLTEKPGPSFLCGIGPYNRPIRAYPTPRKPKLGNLLDIGPSQCGKSTRVIGEILDWEGSVIVNDIKVELRNATAGWRGHLAEGNVFTVQIGGKGSKYDPLEGRTTERELYDSACHLLQPQNEKDSYWILTARKMLTQIFRASRIINERPLLFAARLFRLGLNEVAEDLNIISPELAHYFLQAPYTPFKDFEENRARYDAWTTVTNTLYPILTDDILPTFSGSDFTAKDILFSEKPVTVYFCWPEEDLYSLEPLVRLVWESLIADLKRTYRLQPHLVRQKVLIALDEAGVTKLSRLPEDVATLNGRGCSFSMTGQDIEQFVTLYGTSRARSFLNNIETKVVHRMASLDTAKYFMQWLDHKSAFASSQSIHETTETEGKSEREVPLQTIRQLAEMDDEDVIIFHGGYPPIQANRLDLNRLPQLAARQHITPPTLPELPAPQELPKLPKWNRKYLNQGPYWMPAPRF